MDQQLQWLWIWFFPGNLHISHPSRKHLFKVTINVGRSLLPSQKRPKTSPTDLSCRLHPGRTYQGLSTILTKVDKLLVKPCYCPNYPNFENFLYRFSNFSLDTQCSGKFTVSFRTSLSIIINQKITSSKEERKTVLPNLHRFGRGLFAIPFRFWVWLRFGYYYIMIAPSLSRSCRDSLVALEVSHCCRCH